MSRAIFFLHIIGTHACMHARYIEYIYIYIIHDLRIMNMQNLIKKNHVQNHIYSHVNKKEIYTTCIQRLIFDIINKA